MAAISMHAIMRVFLFVISISSTIPQNKPERDYYDYEENPSFYQENPKDKWDFHRTSSTTSTYEKSESSSQNAARERRGIVENEDIYEGGIVENPDFYEEFPEVPPDSLVNSSSTPAPIISTTSIPFQDDDNMSHSELVYAKFHTSNLTVDLEWDDQTKKSVKLQTISDKYCFYKGSFKDDPKSAILITGCENELQGIQIQSALFGDALATTMNGTIEIVIGEDLTDDMVDNPEFFDETRQPEDYDYMEDTAYYEEYHKSMEQSKPQERAKRMIVDNEDFYKDFPDDASGFDLGVLPSVIEIPLIIYAAKSFRNRKQDAESLILQAELILNHRSLRTKFKLKTEIQDLDTNIDKITKDAMRQFSRELPNKNIKKGTVHILITQSEGGALGLAKVNSICGKNNRYATGMVRWNQDEVRTGQTFAHEIAHTFGVFHDFHTPKQGRQRTCGPRKSVGGIDNQIMNYGRPRHSTWSECSNEDFENYYTRVYASEGFCLDVITGPDTSETHAVHCGGHTASSCEYCPQGKGKAWCNGQCFWHNNKCQSISDLSLSNYIGAKDVFGDCGNANNFVFTKYGQDFCCCENGCCFDRCVKEKPPKECLRGTNAEWKYNFILGYFQAVKKVSSEDSICDRYYDDIGNGKCDHHLYNSACNFDGGDCDYDFAPDYYDYHLEEYYAQYNYDEGAGYETPVVKDYGDGYAYYDEDDEEYKDYAAYNDVEYKEYAAYNDVEYKEYAVNYN